MTLLTYSLYWVHLVNLFRNVLFTVETPTSTTTTTSTGTNTSIKYKLGRYIPQF